MATKRIRITRLWRWRFYGTKADVSAEPVPIVGPPTLPNQRVLDLLKFRPIGFAEVESSLKQNAAKLKEAKKAAEENRLEFHGRCLMATLSREAGILREEKLVTSTIRENEGDTRLFLLLVSNFLLSTSTLQEARMHYPKGVKVKIKHPRVTYSDKSRVIVEVNNPMYLEFIGIELPAGTTSENAWEEANRALENKQFVRAIQLYTRCIEDESFMNQAEAHSNRCQAWSELGCYEIAYEDAKKAQYLDRSNKLNYLRKARVMSRLGSYHQAMLNFQCSGLADDSTLRNCAQRMEQSMRGNYDITGFVRGKDKSPEFADYLGPVRIGMSSEGDKGRGLYATEDIKTGRLILVWNPVSVAPKPDMPVKLMRASLQSQKTLFQLVHLDGSAVPHMSLFNPANLLVYSKDSYVWFDAVPALESLCSKNTFQLSDDPESPVGLWTLPAFLNHSCVPNVSQQMLGSTLFVRAARNIMADEELTLPYMDVKKPLLERIAQSESEFGFTCTCLRCRVEAKLHVQKPAFQSLDLRVQEAAEKKDMEELWRIAEEAEAMVAELPSRMEMDWIRTSYYDAYSARLLETTGKATTPLRITTEQLMDSLHATTPGYGIMSELIKLAKSSLVSSGSAKHGEIIRKECVSILGEQKPEFINWFIDELFKGVDFDILKT